MTNLFLLLIILDKRIGPLNRKDIAMTVLKILFSAALMGSALWVYLKFLGLDLSRAGLPEKILSLVIILVLGLAIYSILSYILGVKELDRLLQLVRTKDR